MIRQIARARTVPDHTHGLIITSLLFQTGSQLLLPPSVTPQQGDLEAYTWKVFNTEQLGGVANMQALTRLNEGKGVGYDLGAVVVNATAPAVQTSPYSKMAGNFGA